MGFALLLKIKFSNIYKDIRKMLSKLIFKLL